MSLEIKTKKSAHLKSEEYFNTTVRLEFKDWNGYNFNARDLCTRKNEKVSVPVGDLKIGDVIRVESEWRKITNILRVVEDSDEIK